MKKNRYIIGISLLVSLMFINPSYAENTVQRDSLAYYYLKLKNLQDDNASLITPEIFGETILLFKKANRAKSNGQESDYKVQLAQIKKNILDMSTVLDRSKNKFKPLFKARKRAIHYNAKKYAKNSWLRGEELLKMAVGELERDDNDDLLNYVNEAIENYRFCEFRALKQKYLSAAIEALNSSKKVEADKWSGISFKNAIDYIKKTEQIIKNSPDDSDKIMEFAIKAEEQAKAAEKYAPIIKRAVSEPQSFEMILIESRIKLLKYASMLGIKTDSLRQSDRLDTLLFIEIDKLMNERKMLISEISLYENELKILKIKSDSCDDNRRRESDFRKKISEIKELFKNEDAEVLLSENSLVLRIFGVKFFSGNSYITPEYFGIFNKITQAIAEFEHNLILVNVYTDSKGNAKKNREISAKQAETVKDFLLKNIEPKVINVVATGRGELMPIASNVNEKGRRLNRRIEIIIQFKSVQ